MFEVTVPVLLIGFNRPELVKQNLENLRQQNVRKLYITIDGPREGRDDDKKKIGDIRQLVRQIDFCPEVYLKLREENVGAEVNVSEGISWVLEKEDFVIVLEDDVMAHESFFRFMQEMLEKYKDDERIAMVSGCNYSPMKASSADYYFCQSGHTGGGWATWKRVWDGFSLYEEIDDKYLASDFLRSVSINEEVYRRRRRFFKRIKMAGVGNSTWDVMFSYYRITRKLLSIVPRSHLSSNVGIYGLHYSGVDKGLMMKIDDEFRAIHHPSDVTWNKVYDLYHYEHYIKECIFRKVWRRIKRKLKI